MPSLPLDVWNAGELANSITNSLKWEILPAKVDSRCVQIVAPRLLQSAYLDKQCKGSLSRVEIHVERDIDLEVCLCSKSARLIYLERAQNKQRPLRNTYYYPISAPAGRFTWTPRP